MTAIWPQDVELQEFVTVDTLLFMAIDAAA
jgi:hypothetical protein